MSGLPVSSPASTSSRRSMRAARLMLVVSVACAATITSAVTGAGSAGAVNAQPAAPTLIDPDSGLDAGILAPTAVSDTSGSILATPIAAAASNTGKAAPGGGMKSTLVLYDTTGNWGWMGELYAIQVANLSSRFGTWRAHPVSTYTPGEAAAYSAVVYIGSTYDEPLPTSFLDDVWNGVKSPVTLTPVPVIWMYDNIWQLTARHSDFSTRYGWNWKSFDTSPVSHVSYKGVTLDRPVENANGIMDYAGVDLTKATVVATAIRDDGTTFPWGLKSGNLMYLGENPIPYSVETGRDLILPDLLYSVLAPTTAERHRALLRLEDLTPNSNPKLMRAIANYLYSQGIPYGFGVSPKWRDPLGAVTGAPANLLLHNATAVKNTMLYMTRHGGTLIEHGYTHQYGSLKNPYSGTSGDDFEFYRAIEQDDGTLTLRGPMDPATDTTGTWMNGRINYANNEIAASGLPAPKIFEFPHYSGSVLDYKVVAQRFGVAWERRLYFSGYLMGGGNINYSHMLGQRFPYVVRDAYNTIVLPENIGNYEPNAFYQFPAHPLSDILAAADANKVVRDGVVGVYYHHFLSTAPGGVLPIDNPLTTTVNEEDPLRSIVKGIKAHGYTFANPNTLVTGG